MCVIAGVVASRHMRPHGQSTALTRGTAKFVAAWQTIRKWSSGEQPLRQLLSRGLGLPGNFWQLQYTWLFLEIMCWRCLFRHTLSNGEQDPISNFVLGNSSPSGQLMSCLCSSRTKRTKQAPTAPKAASSYMSINVN
jgi:hypothetical protein